MQATTKAGLRNAILDANAMGALEIDTTKSLNTKSISADSTFTFSAAPTVAGTRFALRITNTSTTARVATIPSSRSLARGAAAVTTATVPANDGTNDGFLELTWEWVSGAIYLMWGDVADVIGSPTGKLLAVSGAAGSTGQVPTTNGDGTVTMQAPASAYGEQIDYLTGNEVTTSASAGDVGLEVTLEANSTYIFDAGLLIGCTGAGGVKFALVSPASSAWDARGGGIGGSSTAWARFFHDDATLGSGVLGSTAFATFSTSGGSVRIHGYVTTGATAGTFKFQFASGTAAQTSTIYKGSWFSAKKAA